jgi:ergothioneine biosynthesis protein EgtB
MLRLLPTVAYDAALCALVELGLQHEQQHQELLLTDIKHLLACNPMHPAYHTVQHLAAERAAAQPLVWHTFAGGLHEIGHAGCSFAFDNESPRHRVYLQPYALASRLVINAEFVAFVDDGGYRNSAHWLAEGWDWRAAQGLEQPLYWQRVDSVWHEFTLAGLRPLRDEQPAVHLSYFEVDAYARWAGARLPTEAEWEHAAAPSFSDTAGGEARNDMLHPRAAPGVGLEQLAGEVWQWTQSSYAPYPGFRAAEGAVGEYNGKFMVNQYVLRGSSCATPPGHARASYRNFFPATARWQFSGVRLAKDFG